MYFGFKYKPGDFSFINDYNFRRMISYDYIHCMKLIEDNSVKGQGYFVENQRSSNEIERRSNDCSPNVWDTPPGQKWKKISEHCHQCHTEQSYNKCKWLGNVFKK